MTTFQIVYTILGVALLGLLILQGPKYLGNLPDHILNRFNRNGHRVLAVFASMTAALVVCMIGYKIAHTHPTEAKPLSEIYLPILHAVSVKFHLHMG